MLGDLELHACVQAPQRNGCPLVALHRGIPKQRRPANGTESSLNFLRGPVPLYMFFSNYPHRRTPDVDSDQEVPSLLPALGAMTRFGRMLQRLYNLNSYRATKTAAVDQGVTPF